MRSEFWALLTAGCWAAGSLLEKRGVKLGNLSPVMGTTIRTAVSLLLLTVISYPFWHQLRTAGPKSISLIAIGGGLLSGCLGIIFLYTGLKNGNLSTVMTIAFCFAPVIGAVLGYLFLNERLSPIQITGIALCVVGAAMTVYFRGN
jgi:transporter family protein